MQARKMRHGAEVQSAPCNEVPNAAKHRKPSTCLLTPSAPSRQDHLAYGADRVWTPSAEAATFVSTDAVITAFKGKELLIHFDSFRFSSSDDLPDLEDFDIPPDRIVPFEWADSFASLDLRLGRMDFKFPVETPYGARTGQFITLHLYGLELETRVIETLRPKPEPKSKRREPYDIWSRMWAHLEQENELASRKFPSFNKAAAAGHSWAVAQGGVVPNTDTIRKKIKKERPDLVGPIGPD
jgi:hypothetical protein